MRRYDKEIFTTTASPSRRRVQATAALFVVTILWGWTFVWMKQSLDASQRVLGRPADAAIVAFYVALRFAIAGALLVPWPGARRGLGGGAWRGGFVLGSLLCAGFVVQMLGLQGVSPQVSAFLTSLYVAFAAILSLGLDRARPHLPFLTGVLLATLGAGFIQGPPHLTFGLSEWLTVGSALVFAIHILATDRITKAHAPLAVTTAMFVWTTAIACAFLLVALFRRDAPATRELLALIGDRSFLTPLLLAALFATTGALALMNQFQRELDPVRAAILYSLEPLWTTLIAFGSGFGAPDAWLWLGGGALLAGNLIAEWGAARDVTPPSTAPGS